MGVDFSIKVGWGCRTSITLHLVDVSSVECSSLASCKADVSTEVSLSQNENGEEW